MAVGSDASTVDVQAIYSSILFMGSSRYTSLSLRGSILVTLYEIQLGQWMEVADHCSGRKRSFFTTVSLKVRFGRLIVSCTLFSSFRQMGSAFEIFISEAGHLVLAASSGNDVEIHIYFNILACIDRPVETIQIPPDLSLRVEYEPGSVYQKHLAWRTFHQRNVYISTRIFAMSTSLSWGPESHAVFVEDFDVEEIIRQVNTKTRLAPRRRNVNKIVRHPVHSSEGFMLWRFSSRAYHCLWIEQEEETMRLRLVPFFRPGREPELGWDISNAMHELKLPVDLQKISGLLAFCDQSTTLSVITEPCAARCCPRAIRLFQY